MGMVTRIRAETGFLRVEATGEFSLGEAQRSFLKVIDAVAEHRIEKVLYDGRALTGEPETMERFFYGKFVADSVRSRIGGILPRTPQLAYVLEEPVLDPLRYGEYVAVSRGANVKGFDNIEDAFRWLGLTPAVKS